MGEGKEEGGKAGEEGEKGREGDVAPTVISKRLRLCPG